MNSTSWVVLAAISVAVNLLQIALAALARSRTSQKLEQELKTLYSERSTLTQSLQQAELERDIAAERLKKSERLAATHIKHNETFANQAQETWRMYHLSGLRASNAQQIMLKEIDKLARVVNMYRLKSGEKPLEVNESISKIYKEFLRECVPPEAPPEAQKATE